MPSVTDLQQQTSKISLNNNGKSTPPPSSQPPSSSSSSSLQQTSSTSAGVQIDTTNADPITQAVLMLEKKQRNLGKRKEKLESYQQEEKTGKELNKDQKEALAKYGEVIGQIECVKDIHEQMKKLQTESLKNQKRLSKQAAEEKRLLTSQRLREYAQLRYLLDHRPTSLKPEESSLLDELSRVVIPSDLSSTTLTRSVDTVLSIYAGGVLSSIIKNLTGRTSHEVRETLENLIKQLEPTSNDTSTPHVPQAPPTTPASVLPQREQTNQQQQQQQQQQTNNNNDVLVPSLSHTQIIESNTSEYPLQFDTRNQNIPIQQIIQDGPYFSLDLSTSNNSQQVKQESTNIQDNNQTQSNEQKQFLETFTVINSNLQGQNSSQGFSSTSSIPTQQPSANNFEQENSSNVVSSTDEEQWQYRRGNSGNSHRGGQFNNGNQNRNYNRGSSHNNYNQQNWRGSRGGHYDGGQRQYNENNNRGGSGQRGGPNPNYRGNRGGNYRGGNRAGASGYNANGHQKSSQYQQNNEQLQQVRSAPANQRQ